jgi:hypothetical protein
MRLIPLILLAVLAGCAKPDYAMIQQMHTATMQSNTAIANALADGDHKMVSVKFIVEEEMILPAGTRIEIDTNYDWARSVQFNDPSVNPAVQVFQAEAQRDASVADTLMGGVVTGMGIGFGADLLKSAIKNAGTTHLENSGDGQFTLSGGMGDRQVVGTGGVTDSMDSRLASPDSTHDPLVVDPLVVQPTVVQPPPPVVVDPVIVEQPVPIVVQ